MVQSNSPSHLFTSEMHSIFMLQFTSKEVLILSPMAISAIERITIEKISGKCNQEYMNVLSLTIQEQIVEMDALSLSTKIVANAVSQAYMEQSILTLLNDAQDFVHDLKYDDVLSKETNFFQVQSLSLKIIFQDEPNAIFSQSDRSRSRKQGSKSAKGQDTSSSKSKHSKSNEQIYSSKYSSDDKSYSKRGSMSYDTNSSKSNHSKSKGPIYSSKYSFDDKSYSKLSSRENSKSYSTKTSYLSRKSSLSKESLIKSSSYSYASSSRYTLSSSSEQNETSKYSSSFDVSSYPYSKSIKKSFRLKSSSAVTSDRSTS